jgi:cysteine-S-conjugate beta-lyase
MFDFDRVIDRRGTHSVKWDAIAKLSGITAPDAIAMWVADMDFQTTPGVTAALTEEVQRGITGYYGDNGSWAESLAAWMARRHGLTLDPKWVSPTPGIVSGLCLILQAFSAPGDEIVVFPPAYHAFRMVITNNGRSILDCPLVETNGRYRMDLEDMQRRITPKTKIVFFCNPHNPGGTAWSAEEIRALAVVCKERDLLLVSDEIHCDLLLGDAKYVPALTAAPDAADRLITCLAATKTFNLAGAHVGACVTSNAALKRKLDAHILACGLSSYNSYGMLATEAGWRTGEDWLNALLAYLTESHAWFDAEIARAIPGARSMKLDATYLAWVDFSGTGLLPEQVNSILKDRCRIFASPGAQFGPGGASWMRFNLATPRPVLRDAVGRMAEAFRGVN